jgi:hypothetical protein
MPHLPRTQAFKRGGEVTEVALDSSTTALSKYHSRMQGPNDRPNFNATPDVPNNLSLMIIDSYKQIHSISPRTSPWIYY